MTYRLTANKTKLYALAKSFWPEIQPMKHTEFCKYYRVQRYGLSFRTGDYYHKLHLSMSWGKGMLVDNWTTRDDNDIEIRASETVTLDLETLRKFGMLEEVKEVQR